MTAQSRHQGADYSAPDGAGPRTLLRGKQTTHLPARGEARGLIFMTATMEEITPPRAAACPDSGELPTINADELFAAVRYGTVGGLPLPVTGMIPVAVRDVAMQIHPDEWRRYLQRCKDERELDEVTGPVVAVKPRF